MGKYLYKLKIFFSISLIQNYNNKSNRRRGLCQFENSQFNLETTNASIVIEIKVGINKSICEIQNYEKNIHADNRYETLRLKILCTKYSKRKYIYRSEISIIQLTNHTEKNKNHPIKSKQSKEIPISMIINMHRCSQTKLRKKKKL